MKKLCVGIATVGAATGCADGPVQPGEPLDSAVLVSTPAMSSVVQATESDGTWWVPDGADLMPEEGVSAQIYDNKVGTDLELRSATASHGFIGHYGRAEVKYTLQNLSGTTTYTSDRRTSDSLPGYIVSGVPKGAANVHTTVTAGPACDIRLQAEGVHEAWYKGRWRLATAEEISQGLGISISKQPGVVITGIIRREARSGYFSVPTYSTTVGTIECPEDDEVETPPSIGKCDEDMGEVGEDGEPVCQPNQPMYTTGSGQSEQSAQESGPSGGGDQSLRLHGVLDELGWRVHLVPNGRDAELLLHHRRGVSLPTLRPLIRQSKR